MADGITIDIAKNIAGNVLPSVLTGVIKQIRNVVELKEKIQLLNTDFGPMNKFLLEIEKLIGEQQRTLPQSIEECLTNISNHLGEGRLLIDRADEWRRRCFGCCLMCNLNLFKQVTDWRTRFYELFRTLVEVFSLATYAQQIVSGAALRTEALLQPVPSFVGPTIGYAQMRLQTWLGEARPEARMIGVYGMGGIGKTSVLQAVYNNYKKVSGVFDVVIWVTVSQNYEIEKLQASIAETLDLKLEKISDKDTRKMKLYELLGKKKFLLILDDIWRPIDLIHEVGVQFGDHNCSKVLMSSRSKEVTGMMGASDDYSLEIQTLSTEHGWDLFRNNAFTNGVVPPDIMEATARKIASECQGLPLALTVIAKAMKLKKTEREWSRALTLMRNADPAFRACHTDIDENVYKRLKWSYDDLNDHNLKICFLYCAAFPEDTAINVETLVEMWSAEKSVATYVDAGQDYIDALVRRGLIEYVDKGFSGKKEVIKLRIGYLTVKVSGQRQVKVHDVLRDLAIYIGRSEEKCLFATGQHLQSFPRENEIRDCERISVGHNDIQDLSGDVISSELVSLVLPNNKNISKVPEGFLSSAMSLKVLDLSQCISLTSLPTSLGDLRQLEFLKLTGCYRLENLPESTGNLSRLRFLKLQYCQSLKRLPDRIGELRNLNHLNLEGCKRLKVIPHHISHLTSLSKLFLPETDSSVMTVEHLAKLSNLIELEAIVAVDEMEETVELEDSASPSNLMEPEAAVELEDSANPSNLMELEADVKSEIKESTMTTWAELRRLGVSCWYLSYVDEEVNDFFPLNMENLKKLEYFHLRGYRGVSLSNCIYQFQNLTTLSLKRCSQLRELPAYEIGNGIVSGTFPMLKSLTLVDLERLESMVGSSVVTSEETMPKLEDIVIRRCRSLRRLGKKKFPSLKKLKIVDCDEFETLVIESGDLPMLKKMKLEGLHKCQIIVGPSGVINDGVVPELQVLCIDSCGWLEKLALGKLPNLREISIRSCSELRELDVGSGGLGFPMLESLTLRDCQNVKNMVGPDVVWNDETMPKLENLFIDGCPLLKSLPRGIQNLSNLHIYGELEWWDNLIWEDDNAKIKLSRVFHEF